MSHSRMLRVVKVGGSLLDLHDLPDRLADWLRRQTALPTLLVAGGGGHADLVRAADRRWNLNPEVAHQLALGTMSLNGRLLATIVARSGSCRIVSDFAPLNDALSSAASSADSPIIVADLGPLLAAEESRRGGPLVERSWRVTSDSLAAWLARALIDRAYEVELVLLKSADVDEKKTLVEHQRTGVVDECFCEYAAGIRDVRLVNLRTG